jgi:thioredoxin-like negative regulator of GroEL
MEGRMLVALLHAFMAYEAGSKRQFIKMDSEIAQSIRAWPENPMLVFLTGEKLASNGEWEKAAESLEASAAGTKDEWVAKHFAERARELREGRRNTKTFAMDARFLIPFAAQCLATQATDSTAGKKLVEAVEEAKSFGHSLRQRLFRLGGNETAQPPTQKPPEDSYNNGEVKQDSGNLHQSSPSQD